jgi:hypothetical protein
MWTGLLRVELQGASSPPPRTVPHTAAPGAATVPGCRCSCSFFSPRSPLVWLPRWVSPFWHLFLSSGVAPSSSWCVGQAGHLRQHRVGSPRPEGTIPCARSHLSPGCRVRCLPLMALVLCMAWPHGPRVNFSPSLSGVGAPGLALPPPHLPTLRNGELSH